MRVIETFVTSVPREKIPADAEWFVQGPVTGSLFSITGKDKPVLWGTGWHGIGKTLRHSTQPVATDATETVVTREELMRAYDLVEQGYTLWFGGECPVERGTLVDVVLRHHRINQNVQACGCSWNSCGSPFDIIAYRLSRSVDKDVAIEPWTIAEPIKQCVPKVGDSVEVNSQMFGWTEAEVIAVTGCYLTVLYKGKNGMEASCKHTYCDDKGFRKPVENPAYRPLKKSNTVIANTRDAAPLVELDHADTIIAAAIEKRIEIYGEDKCDVNFDKICVDPKTGYLASKGRDIVIITRAQWDDYVSRKIRVGDKVKTPAGNEVEVLFVTDKTALVRYPKGAETSVGLEKLTRISQ